MGHLDRMTLSCLISVMCIAAIDFFEVTGELRGAAAVLLAVSMTYCMYQLFFGEEDSPLNYKNLLKDEEEEDENEEDEKTEKE